MASISSSLMIQVLTVLTSPLLSLAAPLLLTLRI